MDILLVSSVQERISHKAISLFTASTCLKKVALSQITLHLIPLQAIQGSLLSSEAYFVLLHCLKRLAGIADAWGLLMLSGLLQRFLGQSPCWMQNNAPVSVSLYLLLPNCMVFIPRRCLLHARNGGHAVKPPVPTNRGLRDSPDDAVWTAKAAKGPSTHWIL